MKVQEKSFRLIGVCNSNFDENCIFLEFYHHFVVVIVFAGTLKIRKIISL